MPHYGKQKSKFLGRKKPDPFSNVMAKQVLSYDLSNCELERKKNSA